MSVKYPAKLAHAVNLGPKRETGLVMSTALPVRSKYSCGALVVFEQAAESMMALNPATLRVLFIAPIWEEQPIAFSLMISFAVIMPAVLGQYGAWPR